MADSKLPAGFIPDEELPVGFVPDEELPSGFIPDAVSEAKTVETPVFVAGPGAIPYIPPEVKEKTAEYVKERAAGAIPSELIPQQAVVSGATFGLAPRAIEPAKIPADLKTGATLTELISSLPAWGMASKATGMGLGAASKAIGMTGRAAKIAAAPVTAEALSGAAIGAVETPEEGESRVKKAAIYASLPALLHGTVGGTKWVLNKLKKPAEEIVGTASEMGEIAETGIKQLKAEKATKLEEKIGKYQTDINKLREVREQPFLPEMAPTQEEKLSRQLNNLTASENKELIKIKDTFAKKAEDLTTKRVAEQSKLEGLKEPSSLDIERIRNRDIALASEMDALRLSEQSAIEKSSKLKKIALRKEALVDKLTKLEKEPSLGMAIPSGIDEAKSSKLAAKILAKEKGIEKARSLITSDTPIKSVKDQKRLNEIVDQIAKERGISAQQVAAPKSILETTKIKNIREFDTRLGDIDKRQNLGALNTWNSVIDDMGKEEMALIADTQKLTPIAKTISQNKLDEKKVTELLDFINAKGEIVSERMAYDLNNPIKLVLDKTSFGDKFAQYEEAAKGLRRFYNDALTEAEKAGKKIPPRDFYNPVRDLSIRGYHGGSTESFLDPKLVHAQRRFKGKELNALKLAASYAAEKNKYLYRADSTKQVLNLWAKVQATGIQQDIETVNRWIKQIYNIRDPKEFGRLVGKQLIDSELLALDKEGKTLGTYVYENLLSWNLRSMAKNSLTNVVVGMPEYGVGRGIKGLEKLLTNPKDIMKKAKDVNLIIPFSAEELHTTAKTIADEFYKKGILKHYGNFIKTGMKVWNASERFTRLWSFSVGLDMVESLSKNGLMKKASQIFGRQRASEFSKMYDQMGKEAFAPMFAKQLSNKVNLVYNKATASTFLHEAGFLGQFAKWPIRQTMNLIEDLGNKRYQTLAKKLSLPILMTSLMKQANIDIGDIDIIDDTLPAGIGGPPTIGAIAKLGMQPLGIAKKALTGKEIDFEAELKKAVKTSKPLVRGGTFLQTAAETLTGKNILGVYKPKKEKK